MSHLTHAGARRMTFHGLGARGRRTPESIRYTFGRIAGKRTQVPPGWSYRLCMSPPRDIAPESPISRDVWLSLTFERGPVANLMACLTVDEPEGRLIDVELDGDELARLLAGETVTVASR